MLLMELGEPKGGDVKGNVVAGKGVIKDMVDKLALHLS